MVFRESKNGNTKSRLHFGSLHSNYKKINVKMLASGKEAENNN